MEPPPAPKRASQTAASQGPGGSCSPETQEEQNSSVLNLQVSGRERPSGHVGPVRGPLQAELGMSTVSITGACTPYRKGIAC